jgi:hypothetical protein
LFSFHYQTAEQEYKVNFQKHGKVKIFGVIGNRSSFRNRFG